jgi:hypothetical protein
MGSFRGRFGVEKGSVWGRFRGAFYQAKTHIHRPQNALHPKLRHFPFFSTFPSP